MKSSEYRAFFLKSLLVQKLISNRIVPVCAVFVIAAIGVHFLTASHAQSPYTSTEAEKGTLTGGASLQTSSGASNGQYIQFGSASSGGGGTSGTAPQLHVSGTHLIDSKGTIVTLHGVDRSGSEYACIQGWGLFDGPIDDTSTAVMQTWNINTVRVPLNEECWLGTSNVASQYAGVNYQNAIKAYVSRLEAHGMNVILDLHWTYGNYDGPGCPSSNFTDAVCQKPMADAQYAPQFWTSVANTFKGDNAVIFDLFNEPYMDTASGGWPGWTCWRDGGTCPGISYPVAGMQSMVNAVRSTGASNVIMLGGVTWAQDLSQWLTYEPTDPDNNLAAAWHLYNFNGCTDANCWNTKVGAVLQKVPLIVGEFGENDCNSSFSDSLMPWLDQQGASYLAWSWNALGTNSCSGGPYIINDYTSGTPTSNGQGIHDHYLTLPKGQ